MNILFLNPPFKGRFSRTSRSPAIAKGGTLYYPIWLAYSAGVAEQNGHRINLIDAPAENLNLTDIFKNRRKKNRVAGWGVGKFHETQAAKRGPILLEHRYLQKIHFCFESDASPLLDV